MDKAGVDLKTAMDDSRTQKEALKRRERIISVTYSGRSTHRAS